VLELLFNVAWLALSLGLVCFWFSSQRRHCRKSQGATLCVQIITLALLILILLPVVSLTDDLCATATPVEVEHFSRRGDLLPAHNIFLHTISAALSGLPFHQDAPYQQYPGLTSSDHIPGHPQTGHLSIAGIRPPPVFA
jgi:hypothetical protein